MRIGLLGNFYQAHITVWVILPVQYSKKKICGSALRYITEVFFNILQLYSYVMKGPSCNVLKNIPAPQEIYNIILPSAIET